MANIKWELLSEKERQAMVKIISSDNVLRGMPSFQEWCAAQQSMHLTAYGRVVWAFCAGFVVGLLACLAVIGGR